MRLVCVTTGLRISVSVSGSVVPGWRSYCVRRFCWCPSLSLSRAFSRPLYSFFASRLLSSFLPPSSCPSFSTPPFPSHGPFYFASPPLSTCLSLPPYSPWSISGCLPASVPPFPPLSLPPSLVGKIALPRTRCLVCVYFEALVKLSKNFWTLAGFGKVSK